MLRTNQVVDRAALQANIQMYVKDLQNDIDAPLVRDGIESAMSRITVTQIMWVREWVENSYDASRPHPKVESLLDHIWGLIDLLTN